MDLNKIERSVNYRMREFNDEFYLFGEGKSFKVNRLGKIIWIAIGKEITFDELICKILINYNLSNENKSIVENDVSEFIKNLLDIGALVYNE